MSMYKDAYFDRVYFMGTSRRTLARLKKYLVNHAEIYKHVNWEAVSMFDKDKARKVLERADGSWVSFEDRQVTNWGTGMYELESWENDGYEYSETENIEIALRFLEKGCELYA